MAVKEQTKPYITAPEVAELLGVKPKYVYQLTSKHKIPYYCPTGRKILFKREEIIAYIERSRVASYSEAVSQAHTQMVKGGVL